MQPGGAFGEWDAHGVIRSLVEQSLVGVYLVQDNRFVYVNPRLAPYRDVSAETRAKLVTSIAKGRRWLEELVAGAVTNVEQIAQREKCSIRQVNRIITLAFLAPGLVQAAIDGRLPRGIGVESLRDCPAEWKQQRIMLGLAS